LESDHLEVVQLLLKYGANINAQDSSGRTPLHWASSGGNQKTARRLLERGANVHARNGEENTPFQVVSAEKHQDTDLLLQYGVEPHLRSPYGTPLTVDPYSK